MRIVLIVSIALSWIVSAAFAQTAPSSPPLKAPDSSAPAKKGKADPADTAAKRPAEEKTDVADPFASCVAIWERSTHMSRQEWARACRRVADRLKTIEVK